MRYNYQQLRKNAWKRHISFLVYPGWTAIDTISCPPPVRANGSMQLLQEHLDQSLLDLRYSFITKILRFHLFKIPYIKYCQSILCRGFWSLWGLVVQVSRMPVGWQRFTILISSRLLVLWKSQFIFTPTVCTGSFLHVSTLDVPEATFVFMKKTD